MLWDQFNNNQKCLRLGCTDAAPRVAHPRPTRRRGRDAVDRASVPRRAASRHVAVLESGRRGSDRRRYGRNRRQRSRNRADSACIGRIGWNGWVRPKLKKKKGAKRTVWLNLSTQTPSNPHISSKAPKGPLSLRPSSPFSLCCHCAPSLISILCVLSFLWMLCAHCTASAFRCALSLLFSWIFILCSLQFLSESENLYPWLLAVFFYLFFQLFLVGVKGFC